jgi:hypothetical protein
VLVAGGTRGPFKGTLWGARCGVYQPFTIETLIFTQPLASPGMRFPPLSCCVLIC